METSPQPGAAAVLAAATGEQQLVTGGTEATPVAALASFDAAPQAGVDAVKKVIVAVHGIGDQLSFATLQAVVNRFCAYYGEPAAVPLGRFYPAATAGNPAAAAATTGTRATAPYQLEAPPYAAGSPLLEFAFAEVYWATIPRSVVSEQHTLEETKKWARTIVERFYMTWPQAKQPKHSGERSKKPLPNFEWVKNILEELIQTLAVLERLCYLAERAGLFSFDLRKLLDDYLGDVQVVAEFRNQQRAILDTFHQTLRSVKAKYGAAEIYLVAHSEGTVVAFLGLLEALQGLPAEDFAWVKNVRGLMTFGSPIDKHLLLWPRLFPDVGAVAWQQSEKIAWRNYYDNGDPIGFSLEYAHDWLENKGLLDVFQLNRPTDDMGFTRYAFPGKAHVDYWEDEAVFGHFIANVVNKDAANPPAHGQHKDPPPTEKIKVLTSYGVPFLIVAAVLFLAVYILFKALPAKPPESDGGIFRDVASLTLLLLGITMAVRIPRLTQSWGWRLGAGGVFLALALLCYFKLPSQSVGEAGLQGWLLHRPHPVVLPVSSIRPLLAFIVMVMSSLLGIIYPKQAMKAMLLLGTSALVGFVGWEVNSYQLNAPLWPIVMAAAAFFYLWWLAALLFDLVFVWYVHIRHEQVLKWMRETAKNA